jgi:hypothetical protein
MRPARQQAVVRERDLPGFRAVHLVDLGRFVLDVRQLGDTRLHPVRQLVRRDARRRLGIARPLELDLIEVAHQVQRFAPRLRIHAVRVV